MVNFAIIGCGHIAKQHAKVISRIPDANLLAVHDVVIDNMKPFVDQYDVIPYRTLEELLHNQNIDIVNICTPSGHHRAIAEQAAAACKHLIVEKPLALTLEDADAILQACEENNVKLSVVHPNRFRPVVMELRKAIESGHFGKLSHVNATVRWNRSQEYYDQAAWRGTRDYDGGVLMNQAIHNLDLLLWLIGDIDEVYCMKATRLRDIEAEDVAVGSVRFADGTLGVIEAATTIYPHNLEETISIFGESGTVKIGGRTANWIQHWDLSAVNDEQIEALIDKIKNDPYGKPGHQWIIEDMVQAVKENREPVITGEDGRRALQFVTALYESAERKQPVKLGQPAPAPKL